MLGVAEHRVSIPDPIPAGLTDELEATSHTLLLWGNDGQYYAEDQQEAEALQALIDGYNPIRAVCQEKADKVNELRNAKLVGGYQDPVTQKTWQTDPDSVAKLTALGSSAGFAILLQQPTKEYPIIAADNTLTVFAATDAFALINLRIMPWFSAIILFARGLKDAVQAAQTQEELDQIDIEVGWPSPTDVLQQLQQNGQQSLLNDLQAAAALKNLGNNQSPPL